MCCQAGDIVIGWASTKEAQCLEAVEAFKKSKEFEDLKDGFYFTDFDDAAEECRQKYHDLDFSFLTDDIADQSTTEGSSETGIAETQVEPSDNPSHDS